VVPAVPIDKPTPVLYPDSDGEPMSDNTAQFAWIVLIKENLDVLLPDAFVGGDILWYPVEGDPKTRIGPDALVAIGRPKGYRGSYRTWEEAGVVPQIVFEIWSPKNGFNHRLSKLAFYDQHGVSEFYAYDPLSNEFSAFVRGASGLAPVNTEGGWTSPLLNVHFEPGEETLVVRGPDGAPFRSLGEERARADEERVRADEERARADAERGRADAERGRADAERGRADAERARAVALAERLRALGIDPDV
jgi:Uma2 family endonuclease